MEKYIYDESNGLWYELQGDYYIPCLKLPDEEQVEIGEWGMRHLAYIKHHRKGFYTSLLYHAPKCGVVATLFLSDFQAILSDCDMRIKSVGYTEHSLHN